MQDLMMFTVGLFAGSAVGVVILLVCQPGVLRQHNSPQC